MFISIPVLVATGVAIALMFWILPRRRRDERDLSAPPVSLRPRITAPTTSLPPELEAEVRGLIAERQLIEAIKRVREETGLGLKEAKDLVEAIQAGGTPV